MGEATRRKALGIEATPDQPIPADKLRALYPELLEIQLADANLKLQSKALRERDQALRERLVAMCPGLNLAEWGVDFKTGKMLRAVPVKEG
jgi:hypothetical protein